MLNSARFFQMGPTAAYNPQAAETVAHYLRALKCVDSSGNPTVAGILMFGREPSRWLPDARVSAVRFRGTQVSGEFLDRKEMEGRLPSQMEAAIAFLSEHVPSPSRVEGWERVTGGIPPAALREAVSNALAHRDYRKAAQTRLFVFDDRVEVQNPGILLNQLTVDSIRLGGITQRRNPILASLLSRLSRRENLGIGIPEMVQLMQNHGLPEPTIELPAGDFKLILRNLPA